MESARAVVDGVVLVLPAHGSRESFGADLVVTGGAERADSVRAGLAALPPEAEVVLVHDAVRPLASTALFARVLTALEQGDFDAIVPALPVTDTIKRVEGRHVVGTVEREGLVAVQTPQAFRLEVLRAAHAGDAQATDDAALVERCGGSVGTVEGDAANIKITRPEDVRLAEAWLS